MLILQENNLTHIILMVKMTSVNIHISDPSFLPHCGCELQLTLDAGKALVVVGENGIGKSTLLHHLAAKIRLNERVVVEQKTSEYFYDRQLKTLKTFFLESQLDQFHSEIFLRLWNDFGLHLKEDRWLSELSGGEAQVLKLCLSLSKDTELYLLDEPSQFLDQDKRVILKKVLENFLTLKKSLLIIEHQRDWLPSEWKVEQLEIKDNILRLKA